MKINGRIFYGALFALLLLCLCAACAPDETITLMFDGSECTLTGNTDLPTGNHPINVVNTSGLKGWMRICRADPGYVWQDLLDFDFQDDDDVDESLEWPTFCRSFSGMSIVDAEEDTLMYELSFNIDGLYYFIWEQNEPEAAWPCGPITVVEVEGE